MKKIKASEINSGDLIAFEQHGPRYVAVHADALEFLSGGYSDAFVDRRRPGMNLRLNPCRFSEASEQRCYVTASATVILVRPAKEAT